MEPLDHLPCPHLPLSAPSYLMVVAILYHVILPTHHPLHPDTPDIKAGSTGSFPLKTERWSPSLCVVKPLTDKFSSWGKPCFYHKDQGAKENWSSAGECRPGTLSLYGVIHHFDICWKSGFCPSFPETHPHRSLYSFRGRLTKYTVFCIASGRT